MNIIDRWAERNTVRTVTLIPEKFSTRHHISYELQESRYEDAVTDHMVRQLDAYVWGEKYETFARVPDGLRSYLLEAAKAHPRVPKWIKARLPKPVYIDFVARLFRAYPELKGTPLLRERRVDHFRVSVLSPLDFRDLPKLELYRGNAHVT